jgi:hypothetical protein
MTERHPFHKKNLPKGALYKTPYGATRYIGGAWAAVRAHHFIPHQEFTDSFTPKFRELLGCMRDMRNNPGDSLDLLGPHYYTLNDFKNNAVYHRDAVMFSHRRLFRKLRLVHRFAKALHDAYRWRLGMSTQDAVMINGRWERIIKALEWFIATLPILRRLDDKASTFMARPSLPRVMDTFHRRIDIAHAAVEFVEKFGGATAERKLPPIYLEHPNYPDNNLLVEDVKVVLGFEDSCGLTMYLVPGPRTTISDNYFHPHVGTSGNLCYGEYADEFAMALEAADVDLVVDLLCVCLANYDPTDCFQRLGRINGWGDEEEEYDEDSPYCQWSARYVDETVYSEYHNMSIDRELVYYSEWHEDYFIYDHTPYAEVMTVITTSGRGILDCIPLNFIDDGFVDTGLVLNTGAIPNSGGAEFILRDLLSDNGDGTFSISDRYLPAERASS